MTQFKFVKKNFKALLSAAAGEMAGLAANGAFGVGTATGLFVGFAHTLLTNSAEFDFLKQSKGKYTEYLNQDPFYVDGVYRLEKRGHLELPAFPRR